MTDKYYKIGEAAKLINIHEQTIRDYERRGLLKPKRTPNNIRLFSAKDLLRIEIIITLTQELGINLSGVKIIFSLQHSLSMTDDELLDYITDNIAEFRV